MFAPKVAETKTKADASSPDKFAPRTPRAAVSARKDDAPEDTTARPAQRGVPWDFSRIPLFPPDGPSRSQYPLPGIIQPKLVVGGVNDPLEHEADRIADQATARYSDNGIGASPVRVQPFRGQIAGQPDAAPTTVDRALATPGLPLQPASREDMERRFGYDFSRVRIHSGMIAEQSAEHVNARAFTVGNDIVFAKGQFAPTTNEGRRLLAHELTHVVQQSGSLTLSPLGAGRLAPSPSPASNYVARDEEKGESVKHVHDVWAVSWAPSVFNKPFTNLEGEEIGRMKLLGLQLDAGLGARARFVVLKVEAHGEHVHAEQTFLAAGAELGVSKEGLEVGAEAVLVEGKVGGDVTVGGVDVKGSFVIGAAIGSELKIGGGHFKLGAKALIGFEIEFDYESVEPGAPNIEIPTEEETSMRFSYSAHETAPPPPRRPEHRPPKKTTKVRMTPTDTPRESSATASSHFRTGKI